MKIFLWIVPIYMLTIVISSWTYGKAKDTMSGKEQIEEIGRIYNFDKIAWLVSWIPLFNLWFTYTNIKMIIADYLMKRTLRKISKQLHKKYPDSEEIKNLYDMVHEDNKQKQKTET